MCKKAKAQFIKLKKRNAPNKSTRIKEEQIETAKETMNRSKAGIKLNCRT